jgi:hypothetical protein
MGKRLDDRDYLEEAMASLAGLDALCKLLLLRVGQVERRMPSLNGLVEPMHEEIVEVMQGIKRAQQAHAALWSQGFME